MPHTAETGRDGQARADPAAAWIRFCSRCWPARPSTMRRWNWVSPAIRRPPALTCTECGRVFPIRDGIPVLLLDEATGGPAVGAFA